jgi:hypothetical protein
MHSNQAVESHRGLPNRCVVGASVLCRVLSASNVSHTLNWYCTVEGPRQRLDSWVRMAPSVYPCVRRLLSHLFYLSYLFSVVGFLFIHSLSSNGHAQQPESPHAHSGAGVHELPVFPDGIFAKFGGAGSDRRDDSSNIPKHIWVAVVNATEVSGWENVRVLKELNPGWVVHVCDNNDKDQFMRDHFFGSKLLWAYETINPVVGGAAKADIWRYAVLFLIGGVCK